MKNLLWVARFFYGAGVAGIGIQHFIYSTFRPMILAGNWPSTGAGVAISAYIIGAALIVGGVLIIFNIKARIASLVLAILFFLLFWSHVYDQLFINPYGFHLGLWTNALKELAFSGGALVMAATFPEGKSSIRNQWLLVVGRVFFSLLLIIFGIDHFLYIEFVAPLVPDWIPGHTFWAYFAGIALAGAGLCILFKIKIDLVATLAGIMLIIWFAILHIPRAIANPDNGGAGNEVTSVFQALAFAGIAFGIAYLYKNNSKELIAGKAVRR